MIESSRFNHPRFKELLESWGLDVVIAFSSENVYYTSGYVALEPKYIPCATLLFPHDNPVLITPISDYGSTFTCKDLWIEDHRFYGKYYMENLNPDVKSRYPTLFQAIYHVLEEKGYTQKTVGFEEGYVNVETYELLRQHLPDALLKKASSLFREARMIKTPAEVNRLTTSLRITEEILLHAFQEARVGMTELEFTKILKETVSSHNCDLAFLEFGAGPRSGYVNNRATDNRIAEGDVLRLDFGIIHDGYASDISRNAVIGQPTTKMKKVHKAILNGQQKAVQMVQPGVRVSNLFNHGVQEVRQAGFPHFWRPNIGHGIGVEPHEIPRIQPEEKRCLQQGMVINIEMPYYIVGLGGFNVEDTVVVIEDGYEVLSKTDRGLYSL